MSQPPTISGDSSKNSKARQRKAIDDEVSKIYVDRPRDLDPALAEAYSAIAIGIRECTRLTASIPYLWRDVDEYRRLAACVSEAAIAARTAYLAVDIRLRRAGGPNAVFDTLNDVLTVQGRAPLDTTQTPGGLNAILTNLYSRRAEVFASVDGKGCIDRMLDQLARVPAPPQSSGEQKSEGGTPKRRAARPVRDSTQPSRDRQRDILAALRSAGMPLTRPELIEAMKLRTEGKLGAHLAWMVTNDILVNISQRGYWPAGEPEPE